MEGGGRPYRERDAKVEEPHAEDEADDNANASCKVLRDVVCILNAQRREDAPDCLQDDGCPHDPIVAVEEAMLEDLLAIFPDNAHEQGREQAVKG